ncbi:hypothetical protein C8N36_12614 [Pelagimonas varians]|uniref:Uncharacterized protein n=1 Tax=Pelagimonas varians TaxID=696760 RepID=A0A238L4R2_9RHOB|nr:hypothetical protein C8N36_12614 [Pelagimonas varians]SMX50064.1 hypothetical protein PEV8663_04467 [Pelagimonas varians]
MLFAISVALFAALTTAASAGPINFANGWQEQRLPLLG